MCPKFAEISRDDEFERLNGDFQRELKPKNLPTRGCGDFWNNMFRVCIGHFNEPTTNRNFMELPVIVCKISDSVSNHAYQY